MKPERCFLAACALNRLNMTPDPISHDSAKSIDLNHPTDVETSSPPHILFERLSESAHRHADTLDQTIPETMRSPSPTTSVNDPTSVLFTHTLTTVETAFPFSIHLAPPPLSSPQVPLYPSSSIYRAWLDTGAQRSVCRYTQASAYSYYCDTDLKLRTSTLSFKFGDSMCEIQGTFSLRLPAGPSNFLSFPVDVVAADISLIIGLDVLKRELILVDYLSNKLRYTKLNFSLPLTDKLGHIFLEWPTTTVLFTSAELERLHLHFLHPYTSKIYNLIRRARPEKATNSVRRTLDSIAKACDSCQSFRPAPFRFRASLPPDQLVFIHELAIDLVWIDRASILHFVDTQSTAT